MDKKIAIIALVLVGGAACVYAVTEMGEGQESSTAPGTDDDSIVDPPTVPPMQVDAGTTDPSVHVPDEPQGALDDMTLERLFDEGVITRGPSCGSTQCGPGQVCCVTTAQCVDSSDAMSCRGPEEAMPEPPPVRP